MALVPRGRVATYEQLLTWAGAKPASAYMRTIPRLLKERAAGAHRVVSSKRELPAAANGEMHVPDQRARLEEEGVLVPPDGIVPVEALWRPTHEELFLLRPGDARE